MNKEKYLKYKKKYLQLKNNIEGGQHVKISFDETKCENDGESIRCSLKGPKINEKRYKDINGTWIGDYNAETYYEGAFISDEEKEPKQVNKYGFWEGKDYYGILDDENLSQYTLLVYNKKTNQQYGDRFKWFDADSYIHYKFNNNNKIKDFFNRTSNWEFSNGYGDGFCSLYAFFLLYNKIGNIQIEFPIIQGNEVSKETDIDLLKKEKTTIFVKVYLIPLFTNIFNSGIKESNEIEIDINTERKKFFDSRLQTILFQILNLNIRYISDDIFLYLSVIFNVNIIFIPFLKEEDKFNPPILYSEGNLIMGNARMDTVRKQLLKFDNYIILLYDGHYYPIDNPSDIVKYETLLNLFINIKIDI